MGRPLAGALETRTYPIDDLVRLVARGQVRIPSFQRGLRWTRHDVEQLFDSIVSGYPIGNFLLWQHPAQAEQNIEIGALRINATENHQALFVVDGQQRLTSLANALTPAGLVDPRFALSYDVIREAFVPYKESAPATQIPLPTLFDLSALLSWFTKHPSLQSDSKLISRANEIAKAIREFRVPVYIVEQADASVLREIFDRMNNSGKQLTRAEVFTALHEVTNGERDRPRTNEFASIAEQLHAATGFGLLDQQTVFLAFLARRGPDITRDIRREFSAERRPPSEFPTETHEQAAIHTRDALTRTIAFLQAEAEIPHFSFLPNRYLLVVLARFFAHFPSPDDSARRNLRRWLWRTMLRGPEFFKGSASGATRTLATRITPGHLDGSIGALLGAVEGREPAPAPEITSFKTNYAATRLLLISLWARGPRSLNTLDGCPRYTEEDLLSALGEATSALDQVPTLAGIGLVPIEVRGMAGNRILLADPENLMPDSPLGVLQQFAVAPRRDGTLEAQVLDSHLISPAAQSLLAEDKIEHFVRQRQRDLERHLSDFAATRAEWSFEDSPSIRSLTIPDEEV